MTLTVGSLFSGIGGLDLGLERAGFQVRWQVEIDDYCRRILAKHWPDVRRYEDVRTFPHAETEPVDLVCGGFPCQPVSAAGKRRAQADDRWLWPEFARILCVLRPRYALLENVPGLLSAACGDAMGEVLGELAALGYDAEWESLPAAAFGAPHLRWRVFVVAYAVCEGQLQPQGAEREEWRRVGDGRALENADSFGCDPRAVFGAGQEGGLPLVADADGQRHRLQGQIYSQRGIESGSWWSTEPDVGRVAHGVSDRVDRLRGLGNAVVPQVAEWVGRRILTHAGAMA